MYITTQELDTYFKVRDNNFTNDQGMHFIRNSHGIFTYAGLPDILQDEDLHEHSFQIGIETNGDTEEEFIILFRLEDLAGIGQLSYNNSWMRYLNSYAEVTIEVLNLEIDVHFMLQHHKTMIFSPELHFYDEVTEHLTLPEDFEKYLIKNMWKLHEAIGRRYKFSRY